MPLMPPFHDTRFWYHAHVDRFAVLLTVLHSFNITLLQFGKRVLKHGFRASNIIIISLRDFSLIPPPQEEQKICL